MSKRCARKNAARKAKQRKRAARRHGRIRVRKPGSRMRGKLNKR